METEKVKNNSIYIIILFLLVLLLGGYIIYDKVLSNKDTELTNKDTVDNPPVVENNNNNNNNNNTILQNKKEQTIREITVKVENGNIKFISGNKEKTFTSVNAKYIYLTSFMDIYNTTLYYITNNNELYCKRLLPFSPSVFFDKNITNYEVKIYENVEGFVGEMAANKFNSEGNVVDRYNMITVLSNNNVIAATCAE